MSRGVRKRSETMILFFGVQLAPLLYGAAYLVHSFRKRRRGQGMAIGVLLVLHCAVLGLLLWEFLSVP